MTYSNAKGVLKLPDGVASEDAIREVRDGRAPQTDAEMIAALEQHIENYRIACEGFEHGAKVAAERISALEAENAELLASLCEMVRQNCSRNGDDLVSYSLPANAIAMRVLKKHGLLMFSDEAGRVITAQWVSTPEWHQLDQRYGWMIDGVKP